MLVIPENLNQAYSTNATVFVDGHTNEANDGTGMPSLDDDSLLEITTLATGIGMPMAILYQVNAC